MIIIITDFVQLFAFFFLFEHMLRKESFVIKKIDLEIMTDLYVLRTPEFIYAIFIEMYVLMYVSEHDRI